jgi:UDP-N-acetylglucosamine 1-carboxyvinyltransferase
MPEKDLSQAFAFNLGEKIRVARQKKGWTQVDLAHAAGLSSNYVARLERGEIGVSLYVATCIAEAVGLSVADLARAPIPPRSPTKRGVG